MTTIEEVRNFITGFKLNPDEVFHYLNKDLDQLHMYLLKLNSLQLQWKFTNIW